jgi:hypothetical protein
MRLDGLKVVIDCANGAAYRAAPEVLWELGAEVIPLGVQPQRAQHQPWLRLDRYPACGRGGGEPMAPIWASAWMATPTG